MGRAKATVKVKKVSNTDDSAELGAMFEQMTGTANADTTILIPKIIKLKGASVKYCKILNILLNIEELKINPEIETWLNEIKLFVENLINAVNIDIKKKYETGDIVYMLELSKLSEEDINNMYNYIKESNPVKDIIVTTSNLSQYKQHLDTSSSVSDIFIKDEPNYSLTPLVFTNLDLKILYELDPISVKGRSVVLNILHHIYKTGLEIYDIISSPNVDIRKFSELVINSITKLRKQIPRCDKAFDLIENSVKLLETNFTTYYKDSVESDNPNVIMESFIMDVSATQSASPVVMGQFKNIASYLKKHNSNINDPKLKTLYGMLDSNLSQIDGDNSVMIKE